EYRPVTPGVAGSSPVRSATNLKGLPVWEGLFAMGVFAQSLPYICTQEPTQSPLSRAGFAVFSVLNSQYLTCIRWKSARLPAIF
ncbi:hypothetical protein, partial [Aeromonas allosaccharophila]|uniref:hypothetical protein n=1 Tax=Aeromonas allosaccharophila TaxID=656 RepID=UPI00195502E4